MNPDRIRKIIKHAGKLLQEVLSELFGEKEEQEGSDDQARDSGDD